MYFWKSIFNDIVSFCSQTAVNGTEKRKRIKWNPKKKKQYIIKIEIRKKGKKNSAIQTNAFAFMAFYCSKWFQEFTVRTDGSSGFT